MQSPGKTRIIGSSFRVLSFEMDNVGPVTASLTDISVAPLSREMNGVNFEDLTLGGVSLGIGGGVRSDMWDFRMEYSFVSGGDANTGVLGMTAMRRF